MRKTVDFKKIISNTLICCGIVFILIFGIYEGVNYPWRMLFTNLGWISAEEVLPDPAPLPESATTPGAPEYSLVDSDELAEQPGFFTARPPMNVTQLGIIKIPKIQITENLIEGSGDEMFYGVGHVRGTAMPGEAGNCVLAGHRNYVIMRPFRYLDKVAAGDNVYITTDEATYTYEVFKTFEVSPDSTWILDPQEEEENLLTLLTCTPVIGLNRRLIVWAKLTETVPV